MVKVQGDKFLGTDEKGNMWQIFRDGWSNILAFLWIKCNFNDVIASPTNYTILKTYSSVNVTSNIILLQSFTANSNLKEYSLN